MTYNVLSGTLNPTQSTQENMRKLARDGGVAVASAGPNANHSHLVPDR